MSEHLHLLHPLVGLFLDAAWDRLSDMLLQLESPFLDLSLFSEPISTRKSDFSFCTLAIYHTLIVLLIIDPLMGVPCSSKILMKSNKQNCVENKRILKISCL